MTQIKKHRPRPREELADLVGGVALEIVRDNQVAMTMRVMKGVRRRVV